MTDIEKQLADLMNRRYGIMEKTMVQMRNVVPVLKDHGLQNVAQVLDALLFEYDTIEGEIYKLIMSDPVKILGLLLGKKSGKE